jgi:hypothetical protein
VRENGAAKNEKDGWLSETDGVTKVEIDGWLKNYRDGWLSNRERGG